MAGDWIKMRADLLTHPKVVRMASALRADRLRVTGGLFAVWCLFDTHSIDGQLAGYSLEALDELIGFEGFGDAMVAVEWLEDEGDALATPRFDEHNGQSAKRRATESERKRNERKASASDADKLQTKCGPEKRREESSSLRSEDTADFDAAWAAYPKRPGASKSGSLKAWRARIKAGSTAAEILAGVERYAAFCAASGTEPRFIKQPATFFGPDEHFRADWTFTPAARRTAGAPLRHAGAAAAIFDMDTQETFDA